jgi:hypothetical protein
MRRSCAPSIIQNGDPKKSRQGPSTRHGDARAAAEAAEAAAKPALPLAAAAAQAALAAKKPYKVSGCRCASGALVGFAGLRRRARASLQQQPPPLLSRSRRCSSRSSPPKPKTPEKTHNQNQCPLPGAQTGGGTLGMRRAYAATAGDLLRQMTKVVMIGADGDDDEAAAAAAAAEPLLLYDPSQYGDRVAPPPPAVAAAAPAPAPAPVKKEEEVKSEGEGEAAPSPDADAEAGSYGNKKTASSGSSDNDKSSTGSSSSSSDDDDDDDDDDGEPEPPPAAPKQPKDEPQPGPTHQHPLLGRKKIFADPWLARKLRPHQREGVRFVFECLSGLRQAGMAGCVLADGMGLGKTFQACCSVWFLLQNSVFHGPGVPTSAHPIILCPTSLVRNWGNELDKWLEGKVEAIVVDDSRAPAVKEALAKFAGPSGRTTAGAILAAKIQAGRGAAAALAAAAAAAAAAGGEEGEGAGAVPKGPPPPPPPPARMPGKPRVLVLSCES